MPFALSGITSLIVALYSPGFVYFKPDASNVTEPSFAFVAVSVFVPFSVSTSALKLNAPSVSSAPVRTFVAFKVASPSSVADSGVYVFVNVRSRPLFTWAVSVPSPLSVTMTVTSFVAWASLVTPATEPDSVTV